MPCHAIGFLYSSPYLDILYELERLSCSHIQDMADPDLRVRVKECSQQFRKYGYDVSMYDTMPSLVAETLKSTTSCNSGDIFDCLVVALRIALKAVPRGADYINTNEGIYDNDKRKANLSEIRKNIVTRLGLLLVSPNNAVAWSDTLKPSILEDSKADMLVYGMGEQPLREIVELLQKGVPFESIKTVKQTAVLIDKNEEIPKNKTWEDVEINSHEACLKDKKTFQVENMFGPYI